MNRTLTLIIDEETGNMQVFTGGYELDEAGLAFTIQTLRAARTHFETNLIRLQIQKEQDHPNGSD